MDRKWLEIGKRSAAAFMLLLFVAYYLDVNFFVHSHIINGVTIVHSHIHKSSHEGAGNGGHSEQQINLIAAVHGQFQTTENALLEAPQAFYHLIYTLGSEAAAKTAATHPGSSALRAPPALTVA